MAKREIKMKSKKGAETLEHIVKIVLALLGTLVLIGVLIVLYKTYTADTELEKAERTLDLLIEKITVLKNSDENEDSVIIFPPGKGWFLKSYIFAEQGHPSGQCIGEEGCLCLYETIDCKIYTEYKEGKTEFIKEELLSGKGLCKGINIAVKIDSVEGIGGISEQGEYMCYAKSAERLWNAQEELKLIKTGKIIEIEKMSQ